MTDFFDGEERLGDFAPLGYRMRMGTPDELAVGDYERLRAYIDCGDTDNALDYLAAFHPQNVGMQMLVLEWSLQLPQTLRELADTATERRETPRVLVQFAQELQTLRREHGAHDDVVGSIERVISLLNADNIAPPAADRFRAESGDGRPAIATDLLARMESCHDELLQALQSGRCGDARELLDRYYRCAVTNHDALINFTHTYPSVVASSCGEELAERLASDSLADCPAYRQLWELIGAMDARELAAFLAEHLRFHFAGPGRLGSTRVIEDEEKIRLEFDPCGSGGALRRRLGDQIAKVRHAGDATWGRSDEVPFYCTHCAMNERMSTALFGYPRMVTEFDPDPNRPCGWTVYKDPADIPDEVFRRQSLTRRSADPE